MKYDKVYILGDVHADYPTLGDILSNLSSDDKKQIAVIQCGDFGFWPRLFPVTNLVIPKNVTIYACPGNHEDWEFLDAFGYTPTEIIPRLWYMPFGSTLDINGKTFMFCGGANSIDKQQRKEFIDWFANETITHSDMEQVLSNDTHVDVVISHTAPEKFKLWKQPNSSMELDRPSRICLNKVLEHVNPSRWFFGHYHMSKHGTYLNTEWECIDTVHSIHPIKRYNIENTHDE